MKNVTMMDSLKTWTWRLVNLVNKMRNEHQGSYDLD